MFDENYINWMDQQEQTCVVNYPDMLPTKVAFFLMFMNLFKSWHKLLTCELCEPYHVHITRWLVNQCHSSCSEDFLVTWKSLQLSSGLLFWKAAADLSEPRQADQQQEQDIVMDQFVFHFGTFEHSFYGLWLHQDSLNGDEILL